MIRKHEQICVNAIDIYKCIVKSFDRGTEIQIKATKFIYLGIFFFHSKLFCKLRTRCIEFTLCIIRTQRIGKDHKKNWWNFNEKKKNVNLGFERRIWVWCNNSAQREIEEWKCNEHDYMTMTNKRNDAV